MLTIVMDRLHKQFNIHTAKGTKMKSLTILLLILLFPYYAAAEITEVKILDNNFNVIKVLSDKSDLDEFKAHWKDKESNLTQRKLLFKYKLDISSDKKKPDRWLYGKSGLTTILSKSVTTQYQIQSVDSFNQLLGINTN